MESMIPDLVSLVKRKVFTKKEAKQILKARETAEYSFLKKNSSQKEYLKAIQFEYDLERRRREKFKELKMKKNKGQDYSILRRIIFIFDRLTAKYPSNIELWKEYCLFCYKIKSNRMFYKAVSNALSLNWNSIDIWLLAVYYQVEINGNPFRGRKMFLKGLKMNPQRRDFWLEYFRFELKFIETVRKRKEIIGVEDPQVDEEGENSEDEGIKINEEKKGKSDDMMMFEEKKISSGKDKNEELALVVFDTIVETFPKDDKITQDVLNICSEFNYEWVESIKEKIVEIHGQKYSKNPLANLKMLLEVHGIKKSAFESSDDDDINDKFEKFVEAVQENFNEFEQNAGDDTNSIDEYKSTIILELQTFLDSLYNHFKSLRQDFSQTIGDLLQMIVSSLVPKEINTNRYFTFFQGICNFISNTTVSSPGLTHFISSFYEQEKNRKAVGKDSILHEVMGQVAVLSIKRKDLVIIKHDKLVKDIRDFVKSVKKEIIPHASNSHLLFTLAELQAGSITKEEVSWILKQAITTLAYTIEFPEFANRFITFVINTYGVQDAKTTECLNSLYTLRSACPIESILAYVDALAKQNPKNPKIREHLKKAIDWNQNKKELWIRLIRWEKECGNPMECPEVFQRAQKFIKDADLLDIYTNIIQE